MINLAINSRIVESSVSLTGFMKAEPVAAKTQQKTFLDVLGETIRKSALNTTLAKAGNYVTNTEYVDEYTPYLDKNGNEIIPAYVKDIEINGKKYKQMSDEYLSYIGYDVDVLKANALDEELFKYVDENGFIPRYVIPLDMSNEIDYAKVRATQEMFTKTTQNNAAMDVMASKATIAVNNKPVVESNAILNPLTTEVKTTVAVVNESAFENNSALSPVTTKTTAAINSNPIKQNDYKPSEIMVNLAKMTKNNSALRMMLLSNLDMWDPEEEDAKK